MSVVWTDRPKGQNKMCVSRKALLHTHTHTHCRNYTSAHSRESIPGSKDRLGAPRVSDLEFAYIQIAHLSSKRTLVRGGHA